MPDQSVRVATVDDTAAVARILRTLDPAWVMSEDGWRHIERTMPARARRRVVVAEVDGEVVGLGSAFLDVNIPQEAIGRLRVNVLPEFCGRGIGGALYDDALAHLGEIGAQTAFTRASDAESTHRFAAKRGWEPTRTLRHALADLTDPGVLPPMPHTPKGVKLVDLDEAGPRAVFEFDRAASTDVPSDVPSDAGSYDEWIARHWLSPDHRPDLGVVALSGGKVVAGTIVEADESTKCSLSGFTGVLREHRGRGLAKLVKSMSLRKVAGAGFTHAYTSNDQENGPMIAVNTWLGYRFVENQRQYRKILERVVESAPPSFVTG